MQLKLSLFLVLFCVACGDKDKTSAPSLNADVPKGYTSPDAVGQAIVSAVRRPEAIDSLFPSDELLGIAVECTGENPMVKEVKQHRKICFHQLVDLPPEMGAVTYDKVEVFREPKVFKVGDKKANCTFKVPVMTQRFKHLANTTMSGKSRSLKEGVRMIKIGDYGWYLYSL